MRRVEFFRAIELGDEPSAAEGLDLDSMTIESEYDGIKLGDEMTAEFITDMLERFKNGKKLHKKYVYQIVIAVKKIVYDEPTMVEMEIADDATLTVCGDTHGKICWITLLIFVIHFSFNERHLTLTRSILRPDGAFQAQWVSHQKSLLSFQW